MIYSQVHKKRKKKKKNKNVNSGLSRVSNLYYKDVLQVVILLVQQTSFCKYHFYALYIDRLGIWIDLSCFKCTVIQSLFYKTVRCILHTCSGTCASSHMAARDISTQTPTQETIQRPFKQHILKPMYFFQQPLQREQTFKFSRKGYSMPLASTSCPQVSNQQYPNPLIISLLACVLSRQILHPGVDAVT